MIRLLWVIWDGASFDLVRRLLEAGELPALAAVAGGRVLPLAPLSPNCQTPPSLASLFTGAPIVEHGVTGFRMPALGPGASFVDTRSGFRPSAVRRPLLWDRLAAGGIRPGLCHIPWSSGSESAKVVVEAFEHEFERPGLVELGSRAVFEPAGRPVVVREGDDGLYEVWSEETGSRVCVEASGRLRFATGPLRLGPGLATRVAVLARPEGRFLVHTGLWEVRTRPAELQASLDAAAGAFMGKALGDAYHGGRLGPRTMDGGDGTAEDALLHSAHLQTECFTRHFETLLASGLPDGLAVCYLPTIDQVQHELFRWWDGDSRARDVLRRAYTMADEQLARLLRHIGPDTRVVVSSDHGAGVLRRHYHPNETLARAGLCRFGERGLIDVAASRMAYHPAANGSVWLNGVDRTGGIVEEASRASVTDAAEAALRATRDPATGQPPIDVERVPSAERDLFGDLYVRPRAGYECHGRAGPGGQEFADSPKGGTHIAPTGEPTLRGMLAVAHPDPGEGMTLMDVHALIARLVSR